MSGTDDAVRSLTEKLGQLDLTEAEAGVLAEILDRAGEEEGDVEGFGVVYEIEVTDHSKSDEDYKRHASAAARRLRSGLGVLLGDPGSGK